jgi:3-hydroxyisobutyrate dehydrogenase-like beta-hydroxyacid dehydrogenase
MSRSTPTVAVLGQGPMGAALTHALLTAEIPTVVWNRTRRRTEAQQAAGARVAPTAEAAVRDADLVLSVLRDGDATRAVLEPIPEDAFRSSTTVTFATSTPRAARQESRWAAERGMSWLSGAIMVPTPLVGRPGSLFLYSGEQALFDTHANVLEVLGGDARHVGTDHGLASLLDTGMLELFFAGLTGFLHATAMVTAQGLKATDFLPYAETMVAILPASLAGLARDVDAGTYPGTQDNLAMELAGFGHIVDTSDDLGLDGRFPRVMRDLAAAAVDSGHGGNGWSRIIEQLRKPA